VENPWFPLENALAPGSKRDTNSAMAPAELSNGAVLGAVPSQEAVGIFHRDSGIIWVNFITTSLFSRALEIMIYI
jgi:hypothetical protein